MPIQIMHERSNVSNTIDVQENWTLTPTQSQESSNQLLKLRHYHVGLSYIYQAVRELEMAVTSSNFGEPRNLTIHQRSIPLYCMFEWYSITASNYTDMAARLAIRYGYLPAVPDVRGAVNTYSDAALGKVSVFRNKVAAHTAYVFPKKTDNDADQELTVLPTTAQVNGRFGVGGFSIGTAGKSSQIDYFWILTEFHEEFIKRYPQL